MTMVRLALLPRPSRGKFLLTEAGQQRTLSRDGRGAMAKRPMLLWIGLWAAIPILPNCAVAYSTGITGFTTNPTGCNQCHSGGQVPTVTLTGPSTVTPGSTNEYVVEITPIGSQIWGGLDAGASGGSLAVGGSFSASTQLLNGEITHTQRKGGDNNPIRFSFLWTAPLQSGLFTLRAWGNAVNGNGANTGDRAAFASLDVATGPTPTATATPTPTASATPTPPAHDVVVLPLAPRTVKIAKSAPVGVTKKFAVKVRNVDPKGEPAQNISLALVSTTCPAGVVFTQPDFDPKTPGEQTQVQLNPGQAKAAAVFVTVSHADIASLQPTLPFRCVVHLHAAVNLPGNVDPSPTNNDLQVELNFIDLADPPQSTPGEAWLKRAPVTVVSIPAGTLSKTVSRAIQVANADSSAQTLGLTVDVSACPWLSVLSVDFDPKTPSIEPNALVPPGKQATGTVRFEVDGTSVQTLNPKAPVRCHVLATVVGPVNPDPEHSNDTSTFVFDVLDKNDL